MITIKVSYLLLSVGGINSFCLSIMVIAIFLTKKSDSKVEMLNAFLQKYGFEFNPEKEGVYLEE
jgi:hypothetical protein